MKESSNTIFIKEWKEIKRQKCETFTRVMWYLRNVNNFNIWKKSEFYNRKYFKTDEWIYNNKQFIDRYTVKTNSCTTITI
jgi:hypothetical protein